MTRPARHDHPESCVEAVIKAVGPRIVLGLPLGLGKPNRFANALYARVADDPSLKLEIVTALTLDPPGWSSDLERRFVEPLNERLFSDYPRLAFARALKEGTLAANISVHEFFFQPGDRLGQPRAQQDHINANYTHVLRALLERGCNLVAQLVAPNPDDPGLFSLSCNPDITVDLMPHIEARRGTDKPILFVGEVNEHLPYMVNDAEVKAELFDHLIAEERPHFPLFPVPNRPVVLADYAAGFRASALVKDGGTLQLGIGAFSDAVVHALLMRHRDNGRYLDILAALGVSQTDGLDPFKEGLHGSSEMLVEGFVHLFAAGIMKREIFSHPALQRLANEGKIPRKLDAGFLKRLHETGAIGAVLTREDFDALKRHGVWKDGVAFEPGAIVTDRGKRVAPRLDTEADRLTLAMLLGETITGGVAISGCFFLGSSRLYGMLRDLEGVERARINMTGVSEVNELYGGERLRRLQRRRGSFINKAMMVTLGGAVISDALDDYRVVSGVGGQYNFVAMAHALEDARAVIVVPAARESSSGRVSNIVWDYDQATVPRHLRDIVVSEYGTAYLRGRSDRDVMVDLIAIAESAFQDGLSARAKKAGKVEQDYAIPEDRRGNTPDALEAALAPFRDDGLLPPFPFGTDLTDEEQVIALALSALKDMTAARADKFKTVTRALLSGGARKEDAPYLARLGLDRPKGIGAWLTARLVALALERFRS